VDSTQDRPPLWRRIVRFASAALLRDWPDIVRKIPPRGIAIFIATTFLVLIEINLGLVLIV
jgi:hypothetical protein